MQALNGPPIPALAFCVGISGHRNLPAETTEAVRAQLTEALREISIGVARVAEEHPHFYAEGPTRLSLLSQLAAGADQMAAEAALKLGYGLRTVLPFSRESFARDFEGASREQFDRLLSLSEQCWSLPGTRTHADAAYAHAGEATAAQCDLLIAVWDGHHARGLGGTADVVDYAVRRGVPVLHVPTDGSDARILWSGFDRLPPVLFHRHDVPRRPMEQGLIDQLLRMLLLPAQDTDMLAEFLAEKERRWRLRPEFPLMMMLAGVRKFTRQNLRSAPFFRSTCDNWAPYRDGALRIGQAERLEAAFAWADGLADYFAQAYRSGIIFNFVAASCAVVIGLAGFVMPDEKASLIAAELVLVALLILNTSVGTRHQWHRRWLDYRFLAEQLRAMRFLKLFSLASPRSGAGNASWDRERWTQWYAGALWRELGMPPSLADREALSHLAQEVARHDLDDQVAYNHVNEHRMHVLDHRLHRLGNLLFWATAMIGAFMLVSLLLHIGWVHDHIRYFSVATAALPTIGSALFGIRGALDFAAAAARSASTAHRLDQIAERLRQMPLGLSDAARAAEEASVTMQRDLGEWRSAYQHRVLAIPG